MSTSHRIRLILLTSGLFVVIIAAANDLITQAQTLSPGVLEERLNAAILSQDRQNERDEQFHTYVQMQLQNDEARLRLLEADKETNTYYLRGIMIAVIALLLEKLFLVREAKRFRNDIRQKEGNGK